ncbi:MAG: GEVED domain-containing protein, partial [Cyanobacteria bacterium J06607_13]
GPTSIDGTGNTNGYTPCYYAAPVTGIYFVAIYGPSGRNSDLSPNLAVENNIEAISTGGNQRTGISAWDVTIRDRTDATTDKTGRLHTFNLAINMGRNQVYLHSQVYPVTLDGYRYRIDLNGIDPFGFTMFGNQLGNLDSDGRTPLYHDIVGSDRNISNPLGGVVSASPQYPLFFNTIDPSVLSALPIYDPYSGNQKGTGIPFSPILPEVQAASFVGNLTGSTSSVGAGGTFYFDSNLPSGTYEIILSQDGNNFDPYASENKVLRGFMSAPGLQAAPWDGLNNQGDPFLSGTFTYAIEIRGGEYHFPMSDVENNPTGGPVYHLLNATNPRGNNVGFYDHRGYYTLEGELVSDRDPTDGDPTDDPLCGNGPPLAPSSNLATGSNTAAPGYNVFGSATDPGNTNSLCTGSFGDTKTLDLWTYFPSEPPPNTLITIVPSDFGDAPDPSSANATGDYDTLAQNNGPVHALLTTLVRLGDGVTEDINGFVEGIDDQGNASDDSDDGFVTLSAPPLRDSYHLEDIPVNNETNDNATLHGWIDFNRNGRFEPEEHTSAVVIPGETLTDLSWTVPRTVSAGESYARFRITTSQLTDKPATPQLDERSVGVATDGEVEDYPIRLFSVESSPHVLLVKRITAIGAHRNTNPNDGTALNQFVDNTAGPRAEDDNHSYWPENFLIGALNGGKARPASRGTAAEAADEIEYTLYFLSVGGATARGVLLCDRIPANTTLLPDAYRNGPPADPLGTQPNA